MYYIIFIPSTKNGITVYILTDQSSHMIIILSKDISVDFVLLLIYFIQVKICSDVPIDVHATANDF